MIKSFAARFIQCITGRKDEAVKVDTSTERPSVLRPLEPVIEPYSVVITPRQEPDGRFLLQSVAINGNIMHVYNESIVAGWHIPPGYYRIVGGNTAIGTAGGPITLTYYNEGFNTIEF